jgi:uncharacterized protein
MEWGHVGVLSADLHLPDSGSLKTKRRELLRVKNTLARRISCSVAEVDHHELWQRARICVSVVDRTAGAAQDRLEQGRRILHSDEAFQVAGEHFAVLPVHGLLDDHAIDWDR